MVSFHVDPNLNIQVRIKSCIYNINAKRRCTYSSHDREANDKAQGTTTRLVSYTYTTLVIDHLLWSYPVQPALHRALAGA